MEEKKLKKISSSTTIGIIALILAGIVAIIVFVNIINLRIESTITETKGMTSITKIYADTGKKTPDNSNISYNKVDANLDRTINGEKDIKLQNIFVKNYEELKKCLYKCFNENYKNIEIKNQNILTYFDEDFFKKHNLAIFMNNDTYSNDSYTLKSLVKNNSNVTINIEDSYTKCGGVLAFSVSLDCYVLDKSVNSVQFDIYKTTINNNNRELDLISFLIVFIGPTVLVVILVMIHVSRHNKIVDGKLKKMDLTEKIVYGIISIALISGIVYTSIMASGYLFFEDIAVAHKPIIYLYPEKEQEISVELKNKDMITVSYPKYKNGWKVKANQQGSLIDLETNKNLYSLYYECNNIKNYKVEDEGFVVKGENSAEFLEEKLSILGLNDREAEEFIIYWLPKLEANKYNYIRFATAEEIETNMPLEITPKPDTTIRIIMTFKGLDNPIQVKEQNLEKVERNGFVAVEWGGSEIK